MAPSKNILVQNKRAAYALRAAFESGDLAPYRPHEKALALPPLEHAFEKICDRYHYHLDQAGLSIHEHNYLTRHKDTLSETPYLPYAVYLENLRSAHNVGSIFRTTEALRFASLYLSPETPSPENPKVAKTSMGTAPFVPHQTITDLDALPRPWIALETTETATPYNTCDIPPSATFFFGNEEYGLRKETLAKTDLTLEIPLYGGKNSLNVANAFAILAAHITTLARKPSSYNQQLAPHQS